MSKFEKYPFINDIVLIGSEFILEFNESYFTFKKSNKSAGMCSYNVCHLERQDNKTSGICFAFFSIQKHNEI